ncbi:MAG: prepilin-type N-terminal cleavage/methylation domain-containing protein [Armatimonadia bacterium]|nr:prepilin-type N-terminal cleavage/methylation domain-containing protein [Armatimonadia bacterium]
MLRHRRISATVRCRGLTLVEVLLAIVIVLVGITAVVGLLTHASASEERARQKLLASAACQDLLGTMEDAPFAEIDAANPAWSETDIEAALASQQIPNPDATIEIEPWPASATQHLKRVRVRVDYGGDGPDSYVEFETLFADEFENM